MEVLISLFFNALKLLFPRSRLFNFTFDDNKKKLLKAIAVLPEDLRNEMENVYFDLFSETSRSIDLWEKTFAVVFGSKELEKQRGVIAALWKVNKGGQSAFFLQEILRNVDKKIKVIENKPLGNPRKKSEIFVSVCGGKIAVCGNSKSICAYRVGEVGFKPTVLRNDVSESYSIKNDPKYWNFCFFVCKDVVRNSEGEILFVESLVVEKSFRNYVEYLVLKIKPVHSVAVLFIKWV